MTKEIRAQMKNRDKLFSKWQKHKSQPARADFVAARKLTQKALRLARDKWMWELGCGPGGNKFFWTYVKSKSEVSPAETVFRVNGENVSEPERVAAAFSASPGPDGVQGVVLKGSAPQRSYRASRAFSTARSNKARYQKGGKQRPSSPSQKVATKPTWKIIVQSA